MIINCLEILLLRQYDIDVWEYISRPGLREGQEVIFDEGLLGKGSGGRIKFSLSGAVLMRKINEIGYTPLPPYIDVGERGRDAKTRRRYQTVLPEKM